MCYYLPQHCRNVNVVLREPPLSVCIWLRLYDLFPPVTLALSATPKMKFLCQGSQKLEPENQTDKNTNAGDPKPCHTKFTGGKRKVNLARHTIMNGIK